MSADELDLVLDELSRFEQPPPRRRSSHQLATALARDIAPIDWVEFWNTDVPAVEWLINPIIPVGRQVAVYSPAKVGKSLLSLEMAACLASGKPLLGQPAERPVSVIYLDMEMTEDDVRERLVDLGFGPDDDLSRLAYYQLPSLPPLDTAHGGQVVDELLDRHSPDMLIVDTMARVTIGDENDAGTYAGFYAHSGIRLKRRGVALLRLDHAGKDLTRGQRGSSGKADDVDVVFRLAVVEDSVVLTRTHSRIPWVPAEVTLRRETDPVLRHVLADGGWPAGTKDISDLLDELGVPLDATARMALEAIKRGTGKGRRTQLVTAGLKFRRVRSGPGNTLGNTIFEPQRETSGNVVTDGAAPQVTAGTAFPGNNGKQPPGVTGNMCPPLGGHVPDTLSDAPESTPDDDLPDDLEHPADWADEAEREAVSDDTSDEPPIDDDLLEQWATESEREAW